MSVSDSVERAATDFSRPLGFLPLDFGDFFFSSLAGLALVGMLDCLSFERSNEVYAVDDVV